MMSNVNSFSTNTAMPKSLMQLEGDKLRRVLCKSVAERAKRDATDKTRLTTMQHWWQLKNDATDEPAEPRATTAFADKKKLNVGTAHKVTSLAKRIKQQASDWQNVRRVEKNLHFLKCWRVKLPTRAEVRGQAAEQRTLQARADMEAATHAIEGNAAASGVIRKFQRKIRTAQLLRRRVRNIEFNAWYRDCKKERFRLTLINTSFLATLGGFTMMICILLSAAFNDEQCVNWVYAVLQSILAQIIFTGPMLGLVVLACKLFFAYLLIRGNALARTQARAKALRHRALQLAAQKARITARLQQLAQQQASLGHGDSDGGGDYGASGGGGGNSALPHIPEVVVVPASSKLSLHHGDDDGDNLPKCRMGVRRWGLLKLLSINSAQQKSVRQQQRKVAAAAAAVTQFGLQRQRADSSVIDVGDFPDDVADSNINSKSRPRATTADILAAEEGTRKQGSSSSSSSRSTNNARALFHMRDVVGTLRTPSSKSSTVKMVSLNFAAKREAKSGSSTARRRRRAAKVRNNRTAGAREQQKKEAAASSSGDGGLRAIHDDNDDGDNDDGPDLLVLQERPTKKPGRAAVSDGAASRSTATTVTSADDRLVQVESASLREPQQAREELPVVRSVQRRRIRHAQPSVVGAPPGSVAQVDVFQAIVRSGGARKRTTAAAARDQVVPIVADRSPRNSNRNMVRVMSAPGGLTPRRAAAAAAAAARGNTSGSGSDDEGTSLRRSVVRRSRRGSPARRKVQKFRNTIAADHAWVEAHDAVNL